MTTCGWCLIKPVPAHAVYCSTRCRVAAHRERQRLQPLPARARNDDLALVTSAGGRNSGAAIDGVTAPRRRNVLEDGPGNTSSAPTRRAVAALYVREDSVYGTLGGVDCWPASRDATQFWGPAAVVAHPPCAPWGRYRDISGTTERADLAVRAVDQIRRWGGVLEHPAGSLLWVARGLPAPGEPPDRWGGWSMLIRQSWWGHRAPKPTWLYFCGVSRSAVTPPAPVPDPGGRIEEMSKAQRERTPPELARWLVELAAQAELPRWQRHRPGLVTAPEL